MRRLLRSLIITLTLFTFSALARQDATSADDRISDQVRMRLATDADVKGGALDVTVKNGEVTLRGRVDSDKGKKKAEKLAKKVKGVKLVDNLLVVGPPTQ